MGVERVALRPRNEAARSPKAAQPAFARTNRQPLTQDVSGPGLKLAAMEHTVRLDVDAKVHCPHCHRWHPVISGHTEGTEMALSS